MSKRESKKMSHTILRPAIFSILLSIGLVMVVAALGGVLILNGVLPESFEKLWAMLSVFLGALIGPMPLLQATAKKKLPMAYAVLGALLISLFLAKWILWPEAAFGSWWVPVAGFVGATLAGILRAKKPKRKIR